MWGRRRGYFWCRPWSSWGPSSHYWGWGGGRTEETAARLSVTRGHCPGSVAQHATTTERKRQNASREMISNYIICHHIYTGSYLQWRKITNIWTRLPIYCSTIVHNYTIDIDWSPRLTSWSMVALGAAGWVNCRNGFLQHIIFSYTVQQLTHNSLENWEFLWQLQPNEVMTNNTPWTVGEGCWPIFIVRQIMKKFR